MTMPSDADELSRRAKAVIGDGDPAERVANAFDAVDAIDDPAVFIEVADRHDALATIDPDLPLAGLTFVAKNNIDVAGLTTTAGCPSYGFRPTHSAPAVQRLIDAGATCLGATNMDQFATGLVGTRSPFGIPRNTVNPLLVPGGSSSGSAVAVAHGIADIGLGTDTAGSGRVPAAQNRIVGIKPTRGLVPTRGVVPAVRSLDCVSVFGPDVGAAALGVEVMAGTDDADPWSRPRGNAPMIPPKLLVGIPTEVHTSTELDLAAWKQTIERLAILPWVEIIPVDISPLIEAGLLLYDGPWVAERYAAVGQFLDGEPTDADPTVASIIRSAVSRTAVEAYEAQYRLAELRLRADSVWGEVDVLLTPTTPGVATLAEVAADPVARNSELGLYTNFVNLLDMAAVAVPGVDRHDGLPFGVTFLGPAWSDVLLTEAATRMLDASSEPSPILDGGPDDIDIVVVGAHLEGQPLNWQLTDLGGRFVRKTSTTANHRLFALSGGAIAKPALVRVDGSDAGAASIEVEVWRLPTSRLGTFAQFIPAPLGLGRVQLIDGSSPLGFIAESIATNGAADITHFGSWRAYVGRSSTR